MNWLRITLFLVAVLNSFIWTDRASADWIFKRVVEDEDTFSLQESALTDGDNIIFVGFDLPSLGYFATDIDTGEIIPVANTQTNAPGTNVKFTNVRSGAVTPFQNDTFIFQGSLGVANTGIYAALLDQNQLVKIADWNTPIANGNPATFGDLDEGTIDGNSIVFSNNSNSIYRTDLDANSFEKIVDPTDAIPGVAVLFEEVKTPAVDGNMVSFIGEGGPVQGLYLHNGSITTAIDSTDTLPGSVELFSTFEKIVAFEDDVVTFVASGDSGTQGIYRYDVNSQSLSSVVDSQTPVPGGNGNFTSLLEGGFSDKDGQLIFTVESPTDPKGIYISNSDGSIEQVLVESNLLNGESFGGASIESGALNEGAFVFSVSLGALLERVVFSAEEVQSGDINLDDSVDEDDVAQFAANYGTRSGALRENGDLDLDGKVTLKDLLILKQNFGKSNAAFSPTTAVAVPEPSTIFLSLLAIGCLIFRKIGLRKFHL